MRTRHPPSCFARALRLLKPNLRALSLGEKTFRRGEGPFSAAESSFAGSYFFTESPKFCCSNPRLNVNGTTVYSKPHGAIYRPSLADLLRKKELCGDTLAKFNEDSQEIKWLATALVAFCLAPGSSVDRRPMPRKPNWTTSRPRGEEILCPPWWAFRRTWLRPVSRGGSTQKRPAFHWFSSVFIDFSLCFSCCSIVLHGVLFPF